MGVCGHKSPRRAPRHSAPAAAAGGPAYLNLWRAPAALRLRPRPRPGSAARPGPLGAGWAPTLGISRDGGREGDPEAQTPGRRARPPRCSGTARPGRTGAAGTPPPTHPTLPPLPRTPAPCPSRGHSRGPEISARREGLRLG